MKILSAKLGLPMRARDGGGFTLTEMLVTMLILVLASTLLATGIPVAIDTYQKTVRSANAQVALSTTITAMRRELSLASYVTVEDNKIGYVSREEGCTLSIQNATDVDTCRGLQKQYYKGVLDESKELSDLSTDGSPAELISNATITDELLVKYDSAAATNNSIKLSKMYVEDKAGNKLASVTDFEILTRFED